MNNQFHNKRFNTPYHQGARTEIKHVDESLTVEEKKDINEVLDETSQLTDKPVDEGILSSNTFEPQQELPKRKFKVVIPSLNFRSEPSKDPENIVSVLKKNDTVTFADECEDPSWLHVTSGLSAGYVQKEFVEEV